MLSVTERAKERLKSILSSKVDNPQASLRLTATAHGEYGLRVDVEAPGDKVVKHKGIKVLVVESKLASKLDGVTLDVEDTPDGPELAIFKDNTE
jgi:Fe-S cluster assembly iron-binding protein IscA